uniref:Peptidase A1 domain-containing protein n=1 Tax=Ananas comosus var. bracteatus TaxID=296719 RepID=A0A6V7PRN3_ANACO|nr:unnamed protein product [Ananas comosus var. bracteatus]
MSTMAAGATLSLLVLLLITSSSSSGAASSPGGSCSVPPDGGSTLRIIHAFGPCSPLRPAAPLPSWADFLSAQSARDDSRLLYLSSLAATAGRRSFVPLAPGRQLLQIPNYQRRRLGPLLLLRRLPASLPLLLPAKSSTFRTVPCGSPACSQVPAPSCSPANSCSFNMSYGGSSLLAGLVQDSLSLAADVVPSYTFGCLQRVTGSSAPPQGLLGLGRGPLSFLSQTQNLYGGTFSYCLPSFKSLNFSGTLRLGPKGQPQRIKTTPLLANPHRPSLYYVNMTGVRVGRRVLPIPPSALAFDPATGAGTVVDAGTMFTRLAPPAYAALRDEFRLRVRAPSRRRWGVRHVLQREHRAGAGGDVPVRRGRRDAAGGQRADPQHRRHHHLPRDGRGARRAERRAQRHRQHAAAEPPRALRRAQRPRRIRTRDVHVT